MGGGLEPRPKRVSEVLLIYLSRMQERAVLNKGVFPPLKESLMHFFHITWAIFGTYHLPKELGHLSYFFFYPAAKDPVSRISPPVISTSLTAPPHLSPSLREAAGDVSVSILCG